MQQMKLSKREFRNWIASLMAVPVGLFILGLIVGLNIGGRSLPTETVLVSTLPMTLPERSETSRAVAQQEPVSLIDVDESPEISLLEVELSSLEQSQEVFDGSVSARGEIVASTEAINEDVRETEDIIDAVVAKIEEPVPAEQPREAVEDIQPTLASKLMMPIETEQAEDAAVSKPAYSFQVGSFSSRANAEKFRSQLREKGYPVKELYTDTQPPGVTSYKVRIGAYNSHEEAAEAANLYHDQESAPTFIIYPQDSFAVASSI